MKGAAACLLTSTLVLLLTITTTVVDAKRLSLQLLTAPEVYRLLRAAEREDAIPEGRVILQGIAAVKGFALGLKKGFGGAMLLNLVRSNATQQLVGNLNATGLVSGLGSLNISAIKLPLLNHGAVQLPQWNISAIRLPQFFNWNQASSVSAVVKYEDQEICFSSRNARSLNHYDDEGEVVDYDDESVLGRQVVPITTGTGTGSATATASATTVTTIQEEPAITTCVVLRKPVPRKRRALRKLPIHRRSTLET